MESRSLSPGTENGFGWVAMMKKHTTINMFSKTVEIDVFFSEPSH